MDAPLGVLLLIFRQLLVSLLLGELALVIGGDMRRVSFRNLAVDAGFNGGGIFNGN